jgi:hypothetical protein
MREQVSVTVRRELARLTIRRWEALGWVFLGSEPRENDWVTLLFQYPSVLGV